jgi:hypothetical protein
MKKKQFLYLFVVLFLLLECKSTDPTPDGINAIIGTYEGDIKLSCKNTKGEVLNQTNKKTLIINRVTGTDSITITGISTIPLKAISSFAGTSFILKKIDVSGDIFSGTGTIVADKLTIDILVDSNLAFGYICNNTFSGTKKSQ